MDSERKSFKADFLEIQNSLTAHFAKEREFYRLSVATGMLCDIYAEKLGIDPTESDKHLKEILADVNRKHLRDQFHKGDKPDAA